MSKFVSKFKKLSILLIALSFPQSLRASEPMMVIASIRSSSKPIITNLHGRTPMTENQLGAEIEQRVHEKWMIYIHGFDSSADGSIDRVKKIANTDGQAANRFNILLLDWPGGNKFFGLWPGYIHGRFKAAESAGNVFSPMLRELFWNSDSGALKVRELDLVSHSMGGEVSRVVLKGVLKGISEVIMVAPCTYATTFEADIKDINAKVGRVTAYGSSLDKVLFAGRIGTQGYTNDPRPLGTVYRPRANNDYDFINVTCQYPNFSLSNLFYAHFPTTDIFFEDLRRALLHDAVEKRNNLECSQFFYKTRNEEFRYMFWNMGEATCPKAKRGSIVALPMCQK